MSNNTNNNQQALTASIKNKQKVFNQNVPQSQPEHPLFRSANTAKIFPALASVTTKEVASMFGLPEINKRKQKEDYLIEHSNPFKEKPSVFSRDGMRGGGGDGSGGNSPGGSMSPSRSNNNNNSLAALYYNNEQDKSKSHHDQMMKNRLKRPFVVTRHGVSTGAPVQSVYAGCDFEGDEREEKRKTREKLYKSMKTKNNANAFVVKSSSDASRELDRHEFLNSVDEDTMELLKDYIFSGRAALDAAARKRDAINDFRTNQRRSKGIRQQHQQQRLKQIRDDVNGN